jgi:hypothetical protein
MDLLHALFKQFTSSQSEALRSYIIGLLSTRGVMPRADIVFFCKQRGATATQIGNALAKLCKQQRIKRDSVPRTNEGEPAQIFWIKCGAKNIDLCKDNMRQRLAIVDDTDYLEHDGQLYARSLFFDVRAKARARGETLGFGQGITAPEKLGRIPLLRGEEGDVQVGYVMQSETFTLFVEVKNLFYSATRGQVEKLIRQAVENTKPEEPLMPVMIASELHRDAKDFLTYCGVPYLELGRQMIRASLKAQMIELYTPEIALERFQFVAIRPLRARPERIKPLDPRSLRDIAVMSNSEWIEGSRERWLAMSKKLSKK